MTTPKASRRAFLKTSALAATALAFPTIIPARALGRDGVPAPSNRITVGVIGFGPRCHADLGGFLAEPDAHVLAVCDVQASHAAGGKAMVDQKYANADCTTCRDFRELLARADLDAVLVATGDRWHAHASMAAARAGKDVYSEKPCAMTIADCQALADTMTRHARVFQAGTQRRSIGNFQVAVDLARTGRLGRLHTLHASVYQPHTRHDWLPAEPEPNRDDVDWDLWLGPAPWRPFNSLYVQGKWRGHDDFDSGACLLDWGAHTVDLCQWANDADHTTPIEFEPTEKNITARYANGVKLVLDYLETPFQNRPGWINATGTCPVRFVGDEGWVETGDTGLIEASSPALRAELQRSRSARQMRGTTPDSHIRNFLDCVKSRSLPAANPHVMRHSHMACYAAATAWRLDRKVTFDPAKEMFVADEEANRLRSRAARDPWRF